tara:strand:- start:155 stop:493 length:339 start_codon:yes stop_codon:yes gene_type:complete
MKRLFLNFFILISLNGCFQSTAMVGPTMTLVSTGNMSQAFGAFVTNKAVEEETGMQTHEFIAKKVEEQHIKNQDNKINSELSKILETNIENKQLVILLQNNIKKTRNKLNSN